jgi:hypothetical protein
MNSGLTVIYFVDHSFYELVIVWFLQSLLELNISFDAMLDCTKVEKQLMVPSYNKLTDSMKAVNCVCKS